MENNLFVNAGYYGSWRLDRRPSETPRDLNVDCLSLVYYAFVNLEKNGMVSLSNEDRHIKQEVDGAYGCLGTLIILKRENPHLKVLLSIGGGGNSSENFSSVAAAASTRDTFARSAVSLVKNGGFDGIDIDWEHPENEQNGRNFIALLANVRLHCEDTKFILTAALPATKWYLRHIPLDEAHEHLDFLNLMGYDYSGSWRSTAGHNSQLHALADGEGSADKGVDYALKKGFPSRKILLGIPIFARKHVGASAPGGRFKALYDDEDVIEYRDLPRPGTEEITDTDVGGASCYTEEDGWISYDNPTTVAMKAQYCKEKSLGGLFYWTATADGKGDRSLILAGFRALNFTG